MADKVRYTMHVTPIEEVTKAISYTGEEQTDVLVDSSTTVEVIATEVNTTIGGSGEAAVTNYSGSAADQGYKDKAVNYLEGIDSANTLDISAETSASFVFIKNTGYTFSSATVLGTALSKALKVMVGTTVISVLDPGECIVLKDDNAGINCTGIHVRTVDLDGGDNASAGHLAVEYLVVD